MPTLAAGYLAAVLLLWERPAVRRALAMLAPLGRTALSAYLLQSLLFVLIFTTCGAELGGRWSLLPITAVAGLVAIVEVLLARWWLGRHRFGPLEWLWRRWTYGAAPSRPTP